MTAATKATLEAAGHLTALAALYAASTIGPHWIRTAFYIAAALTALAIAVGLALAITERINTRPRGGTR